MGFLRISNSNKISTFGTFQLTNKKIKQNKGNRRKLKARAHFHVQPIGKYHILLLQRMDYQARYDLYSKKQITHDNRGPEFLLNFEPTLKYSSRTGELMLMSYFSNNTCDVALVTIYKAWSLKV